MDRDSRWGSTPPNQTQIDGQVVRDTARLVESEELGVSFFGAMARSARSAAAREPWDALYELEAQTNRAVTSYISRSGSALDPTDPVACVAGAAGGTGMTLLSDPLKYLVLKQSTRRYLPAFRRLSEHFVGTDEGGFFRYVLDHELAIIDFAEKARDHRDDALDQVTALLGSAYARR